MMISKSLTNLPSHRKLSKYLMLLALVLGVCAERGYSFDEGVIAPIKPAINTARKAAADAKSVADAVIAAAEKEAKETVDSAENLPSINNATREGAKATAGTVQRGLKGRMEKKPTEVAPANPQLTKLEMEIRSETNRYNSLQDEYDSRQRGRDLSNVPQTETDFLIWTTEMERLDDKMDSVLLNIAQLTNKRATLKKGGGVASTKKQLLKEQNKLKKKKAKLEKKRKKKEADLERVTKELGELEEQGPPDSELEKIAYEIKLQNLKRKKRNYKKDLDKIDADIKKIDKRLKEIDAELKNTDIASTYSASRPSPSISLVRYFQFMGDLRVDYRVALGMAEGREKTIDLGEWMAASYLDTSTGHPFAMIVGPSILASGSSEVTVVVPSGEISSGKDIAVEAAPVSVLPEDWEFFVTGSFGRYDQNSLSSALDGFQSDTWTTTLGLEYHVDPSLMVGIAYSYAETDTTVEGGQGDIDLTGHVLSAYVVKSWDALSSGLLYSYGSYQNDVSRNTGIGNSQGSTDSDSNTISWMLDYDLVRSENLVMGPSLDLDYGEGSVDGYRERGTGARNLNVAGTSYETMISSIGWEINYAKPTDYGQFLCNFYAGWEHEYMPEDSPLTASLATTPAGLARGISPGITADGAHPGTDWLGLGVNVQLLTAGGWSCSVGYYGQLLRQNASNHIGTIGFSKSF